MARVLCFRSTRTQPPREVAGNAWLKLRTSFYLACSSHGGRPCWRYSDGTLYKSVEPIIRPRTRSCVAVTHPLVRECGTTPFGVHYDRTLAVRWTGPSSTSWRVGPIALGGDRSFLA